MTGRTLIAGACVALTIILAGCGPTTTLPVGDNNATDDNSGATPGVLTLKTYTASLGATAPSGQQAPDDVDVKLTPTAYTIAFKRIVVKDVDMATDTIRSEVEVFNAASVDQALIVDLQNAVASDLLNVSTLPAGTYNKIDIEVFYLDMTVPTIYPTTDFHDIPYRMVFEPMGVLQARDLLLYLEPEWVAGVPALAAQVTKAGWYWAERPGLATLVPVEGAQAHPTFTVFDLFSNDVFWASEHKVLEGGDISPALVYDPAKGGVVTITFDVTDTFDFKDYHDATIQPDGNWELLRDAGIHPLPPSYRCESGAPKPAEQSQDTGGDKSGESSESGGK